MVLKKIKELNKLQTGSNSLSIIVAQHNGEGLGNLLDDILTTRQFKHIYFITDSHIDSRLVASSVPLDVSKYRIVNSFNKKLDVNKLSYNDFNIDPDVSKEVGLDQVLGIILQKFTDIYTLPIFVGSNYKPTKDKLLASDLDETLLIFVFDLITVNEDLSYAYPSLSSILNLKQYLPCSTNSALMLDEIVGDIDSLYFYNSIGDANQLPVFLTSDN